jgi:hypothetical protein
MELTTGEKLIIKAELETDPLSLGLTILADDDGTNADKLNETRDSILVDRASIPADSIAVDIDEYSAASAGNRQWLDGQLADGSVNPAVFRENFYKMFGTNTATRASFDAVAKEASSRAIQLLGRYVTLTPSDIANARNET